MKTKYQVGDKVRVKSNLISKSKDYEMEDGYGLPVVGNMLRWLGKEVTIKAFDGYAYTIYEEGYSWTDEMFESAEQYYKCIIGLSYAKEGIIYPSNGKGRVFVENNNTYAIPSMQFELSTKEEYDNQFKLIFKKGDILIFIRNGEKCSMFTKNKEYTALSFDSIIDDNGERHIIERCWAFNNFIKKEPKMNNFKVGTWYVTEGLFNHFGKYLKSTPNTEFVASEFQLIDFKVGPYPFCNGYVWKEATIKEIQKILPDNHPEKLKIGNRILYTTQLGDGSGWHDDINKLQFETVIEGFGEKEDYSGLVGSSADFYAQTPREGRNLSFNGIVKVLPESKIWDVGTYIVVIDPRFRSGEYTKGKIYQIFKNDSLAWIKDDTDLDINLVDAYLISGGIKWFATLEEAEEFSKELLTSKITIESEMERLGLAVGDTVQISMDPIEEGWLSYPINVYDKLAGVRGDVGTIQGGMIASNNKLYLDLSYNYGGKVLAEAVTKVPDKPKEFRLGGYKVEVYDSIVKVGCTELPKHDVTNLLKSFLSIAEEFDTEGEEDYIFINNLKVDYDTASDLYNYILEQ